MTEERTASCSCGALQIRCTGEPIRRSVCHCTACRQRTGSVFSFNATYEADQVAPRGEARSYTRTSDAGRACTFHFCPVCGATVYYTLELRPGRVIVPIGAFGQPNLFEPAISVYDGSREHWLDLHPSTPITVE